MNNNANYALTRENFDCLQDFTDYLFIIGVSNEMIATTIEQIEKCKPTVEFDNYVRSILDDVPQIDLCWNWITCQNHDCEGCTTDFLMRFKSEVLKNKKKAFKEHEVQDSEDKVYTTIKTDNVPTNKFGYKNDKDFWYNITKLNEKQTTKGLETYGMRLEDNVSINVIERLTYIEEELIDALKYCEWVKDWLKGTKE